MDVQPIRTNADYERALATIDSLIDAEEGTSAFDRLDVLSTLVEKYEDEHEYIGPPDPIEAVRFAMEQRGLTRRDLEPWIGPRGRVAEVLNRRRPLSIGMIRALHAHLGIPAESSFERCGFIRFARRRARHDRRGGRRRPEPLPHARRGDARSTTQRTVQHPLVPLTPPQTYADAMRLVVVSALLLLVACTKPPPPAPEARTIDAATVLAILGEHAPSVAVSIQSRPQDIGLELRGDGEPATALALLASLNDRLPGTRATKLTFAERSWTATLSTTGAPPGSLAQVVAAAGPVFATLLQTGTVDVTPSGLTFRGDVRPGRGVGDVVVPPGYTLAKVEAGPPFVLELSQ